MIPGIVAGAPIVPVWTPAHLSVAPAIWLDWNSDVTDVSGNASEWSNNRGTSGGAFVQASSGNRPSILVSEINGKRALRFSNDYMGASSIDAFQNVPAAWVLSVYKKRGADGGATQRAVALFGNNTSSTRVGLFASNTVANTPQYGGRRLDSDSYSSVNASSASSGDWVIALGYTDYLARTLNLSIDGGAASTTTNAFGGSGATSNTVGAVNRIGADLSVSPGGRADIDLAGVWAGSTLDAGEHEKLVGWAAWQLGLQGNLPVGHTYKSAPPYV